MNIKKIIFGAAVAASLTAAFADGNYSGFGGNYASEINSIPGPSSFKNETTAGRFSNDVDNYMGVNDWEGIKAKKFFSFLGYNYDNDMGSAYNFGFAKNVNKNTYLGLYFGGQLDGMKMTSVFSDDTDTTPNSYTYTSESANSYTASVLVGTKKGLGIKTSVFYKPDSTTKSSYSKADMDEDPYDQVDLYELWGDVAVGLGDKKATHFNIGLDGNVAKATNNCGFQDNSYYDLYIGGGFTTEKSGWDLDLDSRWRITPVTYKHDNGMDYDHYGWSDNAVQFTAAKGYSYNATKTLALKAKFSFPVAFGVKTTDCDAVRVDGDDWVYNTSRTHYINLGTAPALKLGAVYQLKPNKVDLNIGTTLNLGDIGWDFVVTSTRDDTDSASIDKSNTAVSFGFDSSAMEIEWKSGFTVYCSKSVTFDAYYNIVGNLFDGMANNNSTFSRNDEITKTITKVLVPEDGLKFMLTIKM